ncbi:MAG: exodeoxyribonuclease V subunit gamma [Chthoniobacterales bacterium]
MRGLFLHTSNRLEQLCAELTEIVRHPAGPIFQPETVVVQSVGMGRWIALRLAQELGICANIEFLFPQKFVASVLDAALPERADARFYTRENLTWRIMHLLPALVAREEFAELRRYLEQPRPDLRLYQLAEKIAASFDQYLAFRPEMILDWEKGKDANWQAILWRDLASSARGLHPPALLREFSRSLGNNAVQLPPRVSLFGITTVPPIYLQFLEELARVVDVHLFLIRPTREFWTDQRSEREEARTRRKNPATAQLDLAFARDDRRNPLLLSFGKLGRQFLDSVTELNPAWEHDSSVTPSSETILGQIQRDIFELHNPADYPSRDIASHDHSLQFHSCHSPMREMEVLHDQLLALFDDHPGLQPHDIVVMAPDIRVYAPFIEAVFGTTPDRLWIPFSIADRGARAENGVIDTFMRILELAGSRFPASSVLEILESPALQRRFELVESELETIRRWIEKTGIRWGIDAAQRAALGLPAFGENSWRAGLDRLLLGYAAPARGERLFEGLLAYDEIEGSSAETLGRFVEFCEALFTTAGALAASRSLQEWQETFRQIAARFFLPDDEREAELRQLRRVLDSLGETAELTSFDDAVPLDVLLAHLEKALAQTESGSGFLVGKMTFCALKPMRAVPFRVVCLVGMNDTAYPRHSRAPGFDLIAQHPRPGDRSTRDDDRYLFLEALLSARDVFYLSYVGQSIRDNSSLPPSVLVSELLEYGGMKPLEHPLQPFSPRYFTGPDGLFSYSEENCRASGSAGEERRAPAPFMLAKIDEPEAASRVLDQAKLCAFFGNPSKALIHDRLSLSLPRLDSLLEETEPLEPGGLAKYILEQAFLDHALSGEELEQLFPVALAAGELPPGLAGASHLRELSANVDHFAAVVRRYSQNRAEPESVQLTIGRFELNARLDNFFDGRLVRQRLTTRKPKDLLNAWIDHLVSNCLRPTESILITATKERQPVIERFAPPEGDARTLLAKLLGFYREGLCAPLPFFPRSSYAFAERTFRPTKGSSPLAKAKTEWGDSAQPHDRTQGLGPERDDEYFDLAFRNVPDPLGPAFQEIATAIFDPALKVMTKEKS